MALMVLVGCIVSLLFVLFVVLHHMTHFMGMANSNQRELTRMRSEGYNIGFKMGMRQVNGEWYTTISEPDTLHLRNRFFPKGANAEEARPVGDGTEAPGATLPSTS